MANPNETVTDLVLAKETEMRLDLLPNEVLHVVFSLCHTTDLFNLSKVCRKFDEVCQTKSLWRKASLQGAHINSGGLVALFGDCIHSIEELDISESVIELPIGLPNTDEIFARTMLKKLTLTNVKFRAKPRTKHELSELGLGRATYVYSELGIARILEKIKARQVILDGVTVSSDTLCQAFASNNRQMEVIALKHLMVSPQVRFTDFFSSFDNLREFDLSNSILYPTHLRELCRPPRTLEKLMLNGVNLRENYLELFEKIVTCAPNLKFLGVSSRYLKNPEVLRKLARLKNLQACDKPFGTKQNRK